MSSSLSLALCVVVIVVVMCVAVVVVVWGDTLKKKKRVYVQTFPCVLATRPHVQTHVDVVLVHTGRGRRGSSSVLLTKICPRGVITCPRGSTRNPCISPIFSWRKSREQHVAESSIYSLSTEHTVQLQTRDTTTHTDTHHTTQRHTATHNNTEAKRREEEMKETKKDRDEKRYK